MVKLFRKKKDKKNKTPKGGHEVERKLLTEDAAQIAMGDDEIIFEGEKPEIAREIDRVASLLENEITNGIYEEQAKTLHNISLTSDNDDDDTSLENEMNDLTSSQVLLQTELEKVDYGGESDSSGDSMGDMLAQHLIDEDLYLRIHDQLPLVDEYKAGIRQQSSKMVFSRPDPPQEAKPLVSIDPEATIPTDPGNHLSFSERQCRLSQLPSVDEIRGTHMEDEKASLYLEWLVCCLLILVALSIMLPIILIDQTKSREAHVMTFISNHEISKLEDLTKPGTPQNKAARWIADSDGLHVKISTGRSFLDRYALAVLFYALGGDGTWPSDLNFLSREHVCHWTKTTSNELTAGVSGCKNIDGEMVPVGIALGK